MGYEFLRRLFASCGEKPSNAYELQRFINGFRLCWMLQKETVPAWYGQQAPELVALTEGGGK